MNRLSLLGISSGAVSIFFSLYLFTVSPNNPTLIFDFLVLGIFLALAPAGIVDILRTRKQRAIEGVLPDFLRDVAEASKFGTNLADLIKIASEGQYGVLSGEIKKITAQIKWGVSVDEALRGFAERNKSAFTVRLISTVIESNRSGGNVSEVLNIIADNSKETQLLAKEKYSQLNSYVIILLIAYAVFLLTILILDQQFFPVMSRQISSGSSISSISYLNYSAIPLIKEIFTGVVILQGIGSGLMSGVLFDGRYQSGFLYAAVLIAIGYLTVLLFGGV